MCIYVGFKDIAETNHTFDVVSGEDEASVA